VMGLESAGYGAGSAAATAAARSLSFFLYLTSYTFSLLFPYLSFQPLLTIFSTSSCTPIRLHSLSAYHFLIYELLRFILLKMIKLN